MPDLPATPAPRLSIVQRLLGFFTAWRQDQGEVDDWYLRDSEPIEPLEEQERPNLGGDFALGSYHQARYDPVASLSTIAAFPWVYAACIRGARDFAGLPWQVLKDWDGENGTPAPGHPLYALLEDWTPRVTGRQAHAQMWIDHTLAGNHIAYLAGKAPGLALQRLHPKRVRIEAHPRDGWGDYIYDGGGGSKRLPAASILHVRNPSWSDDPRGLWGTGGIEALSNDLATDQAASKTARTLAARGRPDVILSIKSGQAGITADLRKELQRRLDAMLMHGGTLVLGADADVKMPAWAPRDIEFPALRQVVREAVLAVTGVPAHLVGLPVANRSLAEAQDRAYWERQRSLAEDVADQHWRRVAKLFGPDIRVRASFSKIDVLQDGRTARQQRVAGWVALGMTLDAARREEGFGAVEAKDQVAMPEPTPATKIAVSDELRAFFEGERAEDATPDPAAVEAARTARWKAWLRDLHGPAERALTGAMQSFFRAQVDRVSARLEAELERQREAGAAPVTRNALDDMMAILFPSSEDAALRQAVIGILRDTTLSSYQLGAASAGKPLLAFDPITLDTAIDGQLGAMVQHVDEETQRQVRAVVRAGMADGSTIAEMQAQLMELEAFSAVRALRVARTETTTSATGGALQAYRDAAAEGVKLRIEWLSARDSAVRATHVDADGTSIALGDEFTLSDGDHGAGPGLMGTAANNVNCRCTPVPFVED